MAKWGDVDISVLCDKLDDAFANSITKLHRDASPRGAFVLGFRTALVESLSLIGDGGKLLRKIEEVDYLCPDCNEQYKFGSLGPVCPICSARGKRINKR